MMWSRWIPSGLFLWGLTCWWNPTAVGNESSVCLNNCHGHGKCRQHECMCSVGYYGQDCRWGMLRMVLTTDIAIQMRSIGQASLYGVLQVGDMNVTHKNYRSFLKQSATRLLIGSAPSCIDCVQYELEYAKVMAHTEVGDP